MSYLAELKRENILLLNFLHCVLFNEPHTDLEIPQIELMKDDI